GAVVGELRHRAGADGADVEGLIPDYLEKGNVLLKYLFVSANPDRELAALGAARAAADRRVEKMDPRQLAVQPAHHFRRDRAQIDTGRAFFQIRTYFFRKALDLLRTRARRKDDLAAAYRFGSARLPVRKAFDATQVVRLDLVPGALQVRGHVAAHRAQADETE